MKYFLFLLTVVSVTAAEVKISNLPLATNPSTNTFLLISDMNAVTKSQKYLLTNLVFVANLANYTIDDDQVAFDDADSLWTATTIGAALEELNNSINAGAPNGAGAKLHWSQLLGVPAGFADGTDDGGAGTDDQTAAEVPFTPAGNIAATDVQAALVELDTEKVGAGGNIGAATATTPAANDNDTSVVTSEWVQTELADYMLSATLISVINAGVPNGVGATVDWSQLDNVPAGFADGTDDGGGTDDQTAAEVPFTPAGTIAATDVQAALEELDGDITGHDHTGDTLNPDTLNVTTLNADALAITGLLPGDVALDANTNLVNVVARLTEESASALYQATNANLTAWAALATSAKANASHAHAGEDITSGTVAAARIHTDIARVSDVAAGYQPLSTMLTRLAAAPVTITFNATLPTDASLGCVFEATLTDNFTLANPTNPLDGQRIVWELIQDGTGSRLITLDTKFALGTDISAVTLTTTLNKRDFLTAIYNATTDKWYVTGFSKGY